MTRSNREQYCSNNLTHCIFPPLAGFSHYYTAKQRAGFEKWSLTLPHGWHFLSSLSSIGCNHPIIPVAEQPFPSGDGKGHDALEFVVAGLVGHIHSAREQCKAAG